MVESRMLITYFSPTGTTAKIARGIAEGSGCSVREWDLSVPAAVPEADKEEVFLAAMPVFGGRGPAVALERLAQRKGAGQKAVAVVVYGNRAFDDALLELKEALEENGFQVVAAAFVAEHSIVRSVAAGRPDARDMEAAAFGAAVMKKLSQGGAGEVQVPGSPDYRSKKTAGMPAHPKAGRNCDSCGICARGCPVGAIPLDAPSGTDAKKCINCMRCVSVCPQGARSLPSPMLMMAKAMLKKEAAGVKQPETFL